MLSVLKSLNVRIGTLNGVSKLRKQWAEVHEMMLQKGGKGTYHHTAVDAVVVVAAPVLESPSTSGNQER